MKPSAESQSHRFVIVYRVEAREIANAAEVWRGWIERIPDPRQIEAGQPEAQRLGFQSLDELPELIRALIDRSDGPQRKTPDRRSSA